VVKVDRRIRWHYTTTILRLRIVKCKKDFFLIPEINEVSRHADSISRYSVPANAGPLWPLLITISARMLNKYRERTQLCRTPFLTRNHSDSVLATLTLASCFLYSLRYILTLFRLSSSRAHRIAACCHLDRFVVVSSAIKPQAGCGVGRANGDITLNVTPKIVKNTDVLKIPRCHLSCYDTV